MIRTLFIIIILLPGTLGWGLEPVNPELIRAESRLDSLFGVLYADSLADPDPVLEQILAIMPGALVLEGAMEFPWSRLDRIGVKTTEDNRIRIFTWHVMDDPDRYRYFGYMQVLQKRDRTAVFPLLDNSKPQRSVYRLEQSADDWYGKLYYGIVTKRVKRKTYYTLLGMDFNDSRSNIKSVEVVAIQRNEPVFMKEMFFNGRDRVDRVVLEYSDQVVMTARYDHNLDVIAFDHLVPFHPIYKNNFEFYGSDGSFDGLEFEGGTWIFREDLDARLRD
jgi:hypothetical protein